MMLFAERMNMTLDQIAADLEKVRMTNAHKERIVAAEFGFEKQAADEARARGEVPTGSGGFISAGGGSKSGSEARAQ